MIALARPEKPTKEYHYALVGEQQKLMNQYLDHIIGKKVMTEEEKAEWYKDRDEVSKEVNRVRRLL